MFEAYEIGVGGGIPLLAEEGWRDSLVEAGAPGWSVRHPFPRSDHPICVFTSLGAASIEASPYRARAPRPPLRAGECANFMHILLLLFLLIPTSPAFAQGVRQHTRPAEASDPARLRYRLGDAMKAAGAAVSDTQASDVTLTLNAVSVRPIQTWVRTAGRIDKARKVLTASVPFPEASFVKVGQRARAFSPESKSSMFQAWVTKVGPKQAGINVEVTLSSTGHPDSLNYVIEIVTVRGEFLSIPNEAIIEEGNKRVVYVPRQGSQYVPIEVRTGIQGELYTAVESGLMEGDQVVSFGSFFVDSEYKLKFAAQSAPGNDQPHH